MPSDIPAAHCQSESGADLLAKLQTSDVAANYTFNELQYSVRNVILSALVILILCNLIHNFRLIMFFFPLSVITFILPVALLSNNHSKLNSIIIPLLMLHF